MTRRLLGLMVGLMLGGIACDDDAGTRLDGTGGEAGMDGEVGPPDVMTDGPRGDGTVGDGSRDEGSVGDGPLGDGFQPDAEVKPDTGSMGDGALPDLAPDACPPIPEACNGLDDDCDGNIDEDAPGRACYSGPEGTRDVGICLSGWQVCVPPAGAVADPIGAFGACEGEVLPEDGETCDGRDENCDGVVDMVVDPDAPEASVPLCGAYVAERCHLWMGWTASPNLDPGPDFGRSFDTWFNCPADDEQAEGVARCGHSGFDQAFHTVPLPAGTRIGTNDKVGMMFRCPRINGMSLEERALLNDIEETCRITLGEDYDTDGDPVSDAWPPCGADGETLFGIDGRSRCTTTHENARFRGLRFGRLFGDRTDMAVALRCLSDDPLMASFERQTAVWFGWAERFDPPDPDRPVGGPPGDPSDSPHPWNLCVDTPLNEGPVRCVSTGGDGRFHRLQIGAEIVDDYDPGIFGIAVRVRPPVDLIDESRDEAGR